jgi:transcriptional regulator with XRE-family HTH domain
MFRPVEQDIRHSAVGDLIRRHLEISGESQTAFARRAGVSEGAISGYLSGTEVKGWFQGTQLEDLARAMKISPHDLARARVEDLGYNVSEQPFSPHESLLLGMLRNADSDEERDRVVKIIAAALGD